MFGYIYKVTNQINGKVYIGKKHSKVFIKDYYGSGLLIKRAINKYGLENFTLEMIDTADSLEELNEKEKYYINKYNSFYKTAKGYNIASGGDGGNLIKGWDESRYKKYIELKRITNLGERNPNYGNGDKIRGEKNPAKRPDVREKLSKALKGKNNPMWGVRGKNHPFYGRHHSEETKKKISESLSGPNSPNYGKHLSEETKRKISEAQKGRKFTEEHLAKLRGRVITEEHRRKISETKKSRNYSYECKCKICGKTFISRAHNANKCPECKSIPPKFKMPERKYHCKCKICGEEFIGRSSRSFYCPDCKKSKKIR